MPLSVKSRLGPYEIRSRLGVGGMGEVYRAHDSRLNRDVAIKVIRVDGALRNDDRKRFEREARAAAALSHPNIVGIYDFGVEDGQQYIVEELIEGESLSSLLAGKPLSLRKVLDIATQVADGMAAAHAAGLVHRDLKPGNIMFAKDERAKILDFGLARQDRPAKSESSDSDAALAPTASAFSPGHDSITNRGTVLGTPNYMSPEQALGNETDYRSDQFSFGLILYELTTGKRAFAKGSSIETMAAIVGEETPAMDQGVPPPLRWIIGRCLQKERERRYESTRDLYWELRNLRDHFSESSSGALAPVTVQTKPNRWKVPALCAACMLLAGFLVYLLRPSGQNIGNYRYTPLAIDTDRAAWSPDGKEIAYASNVNGTLQVFLRFINSPVPIQLTHQKLDTVPFGWSSDKNHLIVGELQGAHGMVKDYKLYSIATVGGQLEFLVDASCLACDLSRDGKAFATLTQSGTVEISDPLGSPLRPYTPDPFTSSAKGITSWPGLSFSPDGKQILLLLPVGGKPDEAWLLPYPPGGGAPHQISIFAELPVDRGALTFSWMPDSRNVVISLAADQTSPHHLWMTSTNSSKLTALTTGTNRELSPRVSPDGRSILYSLFTMRVDTTSVSTEDGSTKTLITSGNVETGATWSANKAMLAWATNRSGPFEIWIRLPDGSERPAVTAADFPGAVVYLFNPSISPDGERIIYLGPGKSGARLWISSVNGGAPVELTNDSTGQEWGGSWSPDASRFVYQQTVNEMANLMMVKTSGNAAPSVLKKDVRAYLPDWSPTGEWITYRDRNGWWLISPDGKTSKSLGKIQTEYLTFSKNGKILYGIETGDWAGFPTRATLFSLDPSTLKQKVIRELGKELAPNSENDTFQFSMAPDGKSFVYPTGNIRQDLWMLTGYRQPGWRARISDLLNLK